MTSNRLSNKENKKEHQVSDRAVIEISICGLCIGVLLLDLIINPAPRYKYSYDVAARQALRSAATAQEAYFADYKMYTQSVEILRGSPYGLLLSTNIALEVISADEKHYQMVAFHDWGKYGYLMEGPKLTFKEVPKSEAISIIEKAKDLKKD